MEETRDAGHHHLEVSYDNIVSGISISTIIIITIIILHHHHHQSYVTITIMVRYNEYLAMKVVRDTSASV
jgi:hypothetical protein